MTTTTESNPRTQNPAIKRLIETLETLRNDRDKATGPIRSAYNQAAQRIDVLISQLDQDHKRVETGVSPLIALNGYQLQAALELAWPERHDHEQGETTMQFWMRPKDEVIDGESYPAGIYCYWQDLPEEGSTYLAEDAIESTPTHLEGTVCEVGDLEGEAGERGIRLKRRDGTFVTIKGLGVDETRALCKSLFRDISLHFAPAPRAQEAKS